MTENNDEITVHEGELTAEPAVKGVQQPQHEVQPCNVFIQGKVNFCIEKGGKWVGAIQIMKPRARFPIQHPCVFNKPVNPGKHVVCIGTLAQAKLFQPCRIEGKLIPIKGGILGKEMVTQCFDLEVLQENDEGIDQANVMLHAHLGASDMVAPKARFQSNFRQQARRDVSMTANNRMREIFDAFTADAVPIKVEYFGTDYGNRKNVKAGDVVCLDIYPTWQPVVQETVQMKGVSGMPLSVKLNGIDHPAVVSPLQFRAVIQSRQMEVLFDEATVDGEPILVGDMEGEGIVAASAGKVMGLDQAE
jgi:hypothetical protein